MCVITSIIITSIITNIISTISSIIITSTITNITYLLTEEFGHHHHHAPVQTITMTRS